MAGIFRKPPEIALLQKMGWLNGPRIRHPAAELNANRMLHAIAALVCNVLIALKPAPPTRRLPEPAAQDSWRAKTVAGNLLRSNAARS